VCPPVHGRNWAEPSKTNSEQSSSKKLKKSSTRAKLEQTVVKNTPNWLLRCVPEQLIRSAFGKAEHDAESNLFKEVNALRRGDFASDDDDDPTHVDSLSGSIVESTVFKALTIVMIVLNCLHIGLDTEYIVSFGELDNLYRGPAYFIIAELVFTAFFTFELAVRFASLQRKNDCLKNRWFLFDSFLLIFMYVDIIIIPLAGSLGILDHISILRIARLLRLLRMVRLLRGVPQLMMILRGMASAVRAVAWTALLLFIMIGMTAIVFTSIFHEESEDDDEPVRVLFGTLGKSLLSLVVMGTILDDVTACTDTIRASGHTFMLFVFLSFIVVTSFMKLNMLLSIMVEVVSASAEGEEKRRLEVTVRDVIRSLLDTLDRNKDGMLNDSELDALWANQDVRKYLEELKFTERHFIKFKRVIAHKAEMQKKTSLSVAAVTSHLMMLHPRNSISCLDFNALRNIMLAGRDERTRHLSDIEEYAWGAQARNGGLLSSAAPTIAHGNSNLNRPVDRSHSNRPFDAISVPGAIADEHVTLLSTKRQQPRPLTLPGAIQDTTSSSSTSRPPCTRPRQRPSRQSIYRLETASRLEVIEEIQRRVGANAIAAPQELSPIRTNRKVQAWGNYNSVAKSTAHERTFQQKGDAKDSMDVCDLEVEDA